MLAETQAVSTPLLAVMTLWLLLLSEEMRGLLDLEPSMIGALRLQPRQSEEEDKTAGRCCLVLHAWVDGTLLELSLRVNAVVTC